MNYRSKFLLAFVGFILFWFTIFYPKILPYMNAIHINPLISLVFFEGLLYLTMLMLIRVLVGQPMGKHDYKLAFAFFAIYHVIDAVEPPMILNPSGMVDAANPTAIISWDYAIGSVIQQYTGWSWQFMFYFVNILVIGGLLIIAAELVKPGILRQVTRRVLT